MDRNVNAVRLIADVLNFKSHGEFRQRFAELGAHFVPHLEHVPVRNRRKRNGDGAFAVNSHNLRRLVVRQAANGRDVLEPNLPRAGASNVVQTRRKPFQGRVVHVLGRNSN